MFWTTCRFPLARTHGFYSLALTTPLTLGDTLRGKPMLTSKFNTGQIVFLRGSFEQSIREGAYIITKELPGPDGDFMFCIKGVIEPCEHVVKASQIKHVGD
jgi:hypothetical protein